MPGRHVKRHFSQLSEFERGLIIGKKTASCRRTVWLAKCIVQRVVSENVGSCGYEKVPTCGKQDLERLGRPRKEIKRNYQRIVLQAPLDPSVTRYTIKSDVEVAVVTKTIFRRLAEANLKSKCPFLALPLTLKHRQLCLQWGQAQAM